MVKRYKIVEAGWALGRRDDTAVAVKVSEGPGAYEIGKRVSLGVAYIPELSAHEALRAFVKALKREGQGDNPLLPAVLDAYCDNLKLEGKTYRQVRSMCDRLVKYLGQIPVQSISMQLCKDYAVRLEKDGFSRITIFVDLSKLRAGLRWAETYGQIYDSTVYTRVWNIAKPKPRDAVATVDQFWAWHDAATSLHVRLYLLIALLTAQRKAAIFELRWEHVDFERGIIDFTAGMKQRNSILDKGYQKGRAVVKISTLLMAALSQAKTVAKTPYVLEYQGIAPLTTGAKDGIDRARDAAGLPKTLVAHSLRHTAATWAKESGLPLEDVMLMTGHKDVRTLKNVYVHEDNAHKAEGSKRAIDSIEARLKQRRLRGIG